MQTKKPYSAPAVADLGTVAELTQGQEFEPNADGTLPVGGPAS